MGAYDRDAFPKCPGKVKRLAREMANHGVPETDAEAIMAGAEAVRGAKSVAAADWFHGAMARMDERLSAETVSAVREACACCTGGDRLKIATRIRKTHPTVEARLEALNRETLIVGHSIAWEDGKAVVRFFESAENASCACLPVTDEEMPLSYCLCCGGHMRGHVENALGVKTELRIRSTLLSTAGREPCVMEFTILERSDAHESR